MKIDDYTRFIGLQCRRFAFEPDNMFAFAFSKVSHYWRFLEIIYERYQLASHAYMENTTALRGTIKPGTHMLTEEQDRLSDEAVPLQAKLHLEIESYYLFAKILLDVTAHAIEYYFGPARGLSLDSHDDLSKSFSKYVAVKSLDNNDALCKKITELKSLIADFRDYQIAHEKSPRTTKGTIYNIEGNARLATGRLFPRASDNPSSSSDLTHLRTEIEGYVELVTTFIEANQDKTALELAEQSGAA